MLDDMKLFEQFRHIHCRLIFHPSWSDHVLSATMEDLGSHFFIHTRHGAAGHYVVFNYRHRC